MKYVTVYCSSSSQLAPIYYQQARKLGKVLCENNIGLVYGGGSAGLMGELANTMMSLGGKVIGIIPKFMCDVEWQNENITELIITETMHERKTKMAELGDGVIALAGGVGTMEELLEIITWKQLGIYNDSIVILNTNNYYEHLIKQFEKANEEKFLNNQSLWKIAENVDDTISIFLNQKRQKIDIRNYSKI